MTEKRMLVVDDDLEVSDLCLHGLEMRFGLEKTGYILDCAESGKQALRKIEQYKYDVVMLDLHLGDIDGVEILADIKKKWPETDVIMMTAETSPAHAVKAMKLGAYDYLLKPFMIDELILVVEKCLYKRKMAVEIRELRKHKAVLEMGRMAAIGKISMGLAQELNSPLFGIITSIEAICRREGEQGKNYALLQEVKQAVGFCAKIISDLASFIKPVGKEFKLFNCGEALENSINMVATQLAAKNIKIIKNITTLAEIMGDREQFQLALVNILVNAKDAMVDGGELTVTAGIDSETSNVKLEFADTGCGISSENLPIVFDPFFSTKEYGDGIGLGLSVSYGIIKNHNGNIDVRSELNKGTTFTVKLPVGGNNA